MRSRSSRFFVILLHLVGCPRHFQNTLDGIIGVQPWPIVLQTLSPEEQVHAEPIWLQDEATQTCLGPQGKFTPDCGDATLWLALPQTTLQQPRQEIKRLKRKRARMGLWGVDEEASQQITILQQQPQQALVERQGWVFYLVDRDVQEILQATAPPSRRPWWKVWAPKKNNENHNKNNHNQPHERTSSSSIIAPLECLVYEPRVGTMAVQPCDHALHQIPQETALPTWGWKIDATNNNSLQPTVKLHKNDVDQCANYNNSMGQGQVKLAECGTPGQVQLSMVRYQPVAAVPEAKLPHQHQHNSKDNHHMPRSEQSSTTQSTETASSRQQQETQEQEEEESHLPSIRDLAHKTALGTAMHTQELTLPSARLLFEKRNQGTNGNGKSKPKRAGGLLQRSNPILLAGGSSTYKNIRQSSSSSSSPFEDAAPVEEATASVHHRNRRIPTHPYIAAAQNEVWTDPQTGLEYHTDLSGYLGHDRQERGRHTLMGVGQYRKGYVIKVYGIAYYVSKRDVLADPFFEKYADMTAQELQSHPEFYDHLRLHPENFERTIFIQTNMQLSAETIRGSLKADWSMLTDEAKDTILESSMKPQEMDDRTLEIINDPGNPGRCSCMSLVPEHLNADPACCARGTELVFTWLKNGDIECRLNGRIVEVFPRPDIAQGIFFEYLRYDDPISPELKDNVVDGFPFLLAPLAQVKGVRIGQAPGASSGKQNSSGGENPIARAFSEFTDSVGSHAAGMAEAVQRAAADTASNTQKAFGEAVRSVGDAARHMGDSAQDFGREFNRRREDFAKKAASFPDAMAKLRKDPMQAIKDWMPKDNTNDIALIAGVLEEVEPIPELKLSSSGRLFGYPLSRWFGDVYYAPDEIGPMIIHPTMDMTRKIFLFLVHLYLLLLFIVSFPGSYTTRTKLIRRHSKSKCRVIPSDTESESDEDSSEDTQNREQRIKAKQFFSPRLSRGSRGVTLSLSSVSGNKQTGKSPAEDSSLGENENESSPTALSPPLKKKSLSYYL